MRETRELAAACLRHIRETLQAAHSHVTHGEMLEAIGDVEKALEHKDADEGLRDLVALSEALDLTISDDELEKAAVTFDDESELEPDDDDDDDAEKTGR